MNQMNITQDDYKNAAVQLQNHFENVPEAIKPVSIIQNGNVGTVGVSDIDLIFVFSDNFDKGEEFSKEYTRAVDPIRYKEVFFVHQPMLLSESAINELPYFTFNPARDLNVLYGAEPTFKASEPPPIQSALISLEFIQFRLFQLLNQLLSGQISLHGILLRGHSLKHSLTLAKRAGLSFGNEKFPAFEIIKAVRASINKGQEIKLSSEELTNLYKSMIREFYVVYKDFCKKIESYVSFYMPRADYYEYDSNVNMSNLFDTKNQLNRKMVNNKVHLDGFHWANMLLRDIYFDNDASQTFLCDPEFIEECNKRADVHRKQWHWNKRNFRTIHAGLSPMPCIIGKQAQNYAGTYWGI